MGTANAYLLNEEQKQPVSPPPPSADEVRSSARLGSWQAEAEPATPPPPAQEPEAAFLRPATPPSRQGYPAEAAAMPALAVLGAEEATLDVISLQEA